METKSEDQDSSKTPGSLGVTTESPRPALERPLHSHNDHCAPNCAEEYERTDLEKVIAMGKTWGSEIIAVHRIGEYAFVEYADRDFSMGPNYGNETGEVCFGEFIDGRSICRAAHSLDAALVEAIAYKRDGCNSQAARFFLRATDPVTDEQKG